MPWKKVTVIVSLTSFALYILLGCAAFIAQRRLMYPRPANPIEPRIDGASLERVTRADGAVVYALHAPAPPGEPTLVHFHGNGEDVAGLGALFRAMRNAHLGIYAVEYPGYGLAASQALNEDSIYSCAQTALEHLLELGVSRDSIVLEGQSLGTGVAAEMARRSLGARLVLISPYTSMVEMAARVAPFLPVRWLVRDRYETDHKAPGLTLPTLVVHGTDDEVIPFEMGQRVAALLPNHDFISVEGGHHSDVFNAGGVALVNKIAAFARGNH